jgi:hypothetical protein
MSAYTIRRETIKRVGAAVERERLQAFLMHVGHPGHVDIPYTVTKRRTVTEVLDTLSVDAPERAFFRAIWNFFMLFQMDNSIAGEFLRGLNRLLKIPTSAI